MTDKEVIEKLKYRIARLEEELSQGKRLTHRADEDIISDLLGTITQLRQGLQQVVDTSPFASAKDLGEMAQYHLDLNP